jgi:hypothetical protein
MKMKRVEIKSQTIASIWHFAITNLGSVEYMRWSERLRLPRGEKIGVNSKIM